ncbi:MAG: hypothetical protein AAF890_07460 [Pseudomonadota bacterium]
MKTILLAVLVLFFGLHAITYFVPPKANPILPWTPLWVAGNAANWSSDTEFSNQYIKEMLDSGERAAANRFFFQAIGTYNTYDKRWSFLSKTNVYEWMDAKNFKSISWSFPIRKQFDDYQFRSALKARNSGFFIYAFNTVSSYSGDQEAASRQRGQFMYNAALAMNSLSKCNWTLAGMVEALGQRAVSERIFKLFEVSQKHAGRWYRTEDHLYAACKRQRSYKNLQEVRAMISPSYIAALQKQAASRHMVRNLRREHEANRKKRRLAAKKARREGNDPVSRLRARLGLCANNANSRCKNSSKANPTPVFAQPSRMCHARRSQCFATCEGLSDGRVTGLLSALTSLGGPRAKCKDQCRAIQC